MGLFGGEKIMLTLEKYDYKPGDVIKGTITLNLKKPTMARKLEVAFVGIKIQSQSGGVRIGGTTSSRHQHTQPSHQIIYNFRMPLDGEKEYQEGNYPFEIKIPSNILQSEPNLEGKLGAAVNVFKALGGVSAHTEWQVEAQLDVPMKLDIRKNQKIVLSPT